MTENNNIIVVHEQQGEESYYPIDHFCEFKISTRSNPKEGQTVTEPLARMSLIVPESMKKIPDSDIAELLNSAVEAGLVFADHRASLYRLTEYSCWKKLENLVPAYVLSRINNNIEFALKAGRNEPHESVDNLYTEICNLAELASFDRRQISAIPGIGKKTMELFDDLIVKNRLYWGFSMEALKELGCYL